MPNQDKPAGGFRSSERAGSHWWPLTTVKHQVCLTSFLSMLSLSVCVAWRSSEAGRMTGNYLKVKEESNLLEYLKKKEEIGDLI